MKTTQRELNRRNLRKAKEVRDEVHTNKQDMMILFKRGELQNVKNAIFYRII